MINEEGPIVEELMMAISTPMCEIDKDQQSRVYKTEIDNEDSFSFTKKKQPFGARIGHYETAATKG